MISYISRFFNKKMPKVYKSCDTLWRYNFDKILETEDYRWLIHDFNENSELVINEKTLVFLQEIWHKIFEEYVTLKGDQLVVNNLKKRAYLAKIQNKMFWGATLLKLIINNPETKNLKEISDSLAKHGFKLDIKKPLDTQIDSLSKQLKSLRTKFNLEVSKYEKTLENSKNKERANSLDQFRAIERVLELKYPLNTKEFTVSQSIAYIKDAERVIKEKKKQVQNG